MKPRSLLSLTFPLGRTAVLSLVLLTMVLAPAELLARSTWVRTRFPFPGVNSSNPGFDERWQALDHVAMTEGQIDCLVLGSSMVENGFDQETWNTAFNQAAHRDLKCMHFGIGGMVAAQVGEVAQLLQMAYHPQVVIYGTSARDYSDVIGEANILGANDILDTPWIQYRLNQEISLEGWLIDHSYAFHYSLVIHQWLQKAAGSEKNLTERPPVDLAQPPDRVTEQGLYQVLANYEVSPQGLAGLEQVLALEAEGVQVFIVEMPVHPSYIHFFGHGEQDMEEFRERVAATAAAHGVSFWRVDPGLALPDDNWNDRNHLNNQGRVAFTQWLASKLAVELVQANQAR